MAPRICVIPNSDPNEPTAPTIISLPHPRTNVPTRYLLHPSKGIHELTMIPSTTVRPRSWLLTAPRTNAKPSEQAPEGDGDDDKSAKWIGSGQVLEDGALYISTPIDPLFLILAPLLPARTNDKKRHFLPLDDILESLSDGEDRPAMHWASVIQTGSTTRKHLEARIRSASETVDVGDEKAYRLSPEKVLNILAKKCVRMATGGLPKSLEDEFVTKPLVRPVTTDSAPEERKTADLEVRGDDVAESKAQLPPPVPPPAVAATSEPGRTRPADTSASPEMFQLLRLRIASQFLATTYLPLHIGTLLVSHLNSVHDFASLDAHLDDLKKLRAEATAARSGDFSLKRSMNDDEINDIRAEKKRKQEREDMEKNKKKNASNGVKQLNKANTRGMAKMTSFFKKKE